MVSFLLFELPFQIPPILIQIYGPENPNRGWYYILTVCVLMLFFRNYRRMGGIAFIFFLCAMLIWNWLQELYRQFTPAE